MRDTQEPSRKRKREARDEHRGKLRFFIHRTSAHPAAHLSLGVAYPSKIRQRVNEAGLDLEAKHSRECWLRGG
jgi:hypothetical protein